MPSLRQSCLSRASTLLTRTYNQEEAKEPRKPNQPAYDPPLPTSNTRFHSQPKYYPPNHPFWTQTQYRDHASLQLQLASQSLPTPHGYSRELYRISNSTVHSLTHRRLHLLIAA
ncbi:unnamed protein product [Tuber melanosporum]|uniref:(Perigord truffle) hypothetical protein n=1 Tax=Tuber melanosporum (strain Mel28) TaxID=656061 RepID=D5G656_TUBMM|nr:uncharacterized protein GSTUM_00001779001 [Tuber melanosporum]CAZ79999.1 unnamed protein product [Tuber melanosporum]